MYQLSGLHRCHGAPRSFRVPRRNFAATDAAIADGALGAVTAVGKEKCGFINLAIDISPRCDCVGFADMPIVPNLGVFASKDPVAIDMACLDKVRESHGMPGSIADDFDLLDPGTRKFETVSATVHGLSEETQINTGTLNGLGNREYTLIDTEPQPMKRHVFALDQRPTGERFRKNSSNSPPSRMSAMMARASYASRRSIQICQSLAWQWQQWWCGRLA